MRSLDSLPSRDQFIRDLLAADLEGLGWFVETICTSGLTADGNGQTVEIKVVDGRLWDVDVCEFVRFGKFVWLPEPMDTGAMHGPMGRDGVSTWPRRTPNGGLEWACCRSEIGPPCRHRVDPQTLLLISLGVVTAAPYDMGKLHGPLTAVQTRPSYWEILDFNGRLVEICHTLFDHMPASERQRKIMSSYSTREA
jgi:hypothetical protein